MSDPDSLNDVLDEIVETADGQPESQPLTLGDLLHSVGRRSYGPLLLVVGLIAISPITAIPGLTWAVAVLTLVIALQIAIGRERVWLPKSVLRIKVGRRKVHDGVQKSRSTARWIDQLLRPRLEFLSRPPFVNVVGIICVLAALITFPLGLVPLLPLIPGIAVVAFGLGMTARDGLWLAIGVALTLFVLALASPMVI